ncbi:MAG: class I SAM-dependent methyltransferase [Phycisphaerales bacterium]
MTPTQLHNPSASQSTPEAQKAPQSATLPLAERLRGALHPHNPYTGFDAEGRTPTPPATNRDVFLPVIEKLRPALAVEVGAWKGASSIVFAQAMRKANTDSCLVCVDTWLGSIEHFTNPPSEAWDLRPTMKNGFPRLYEFWLTSVLAAGVEDQVVPLANTSTTAAKWFGRVGLRPGFVFIDAGHDEDDVTTDINAWWPLLMNGGVMAGDDWSPMWPGVEAAVTKFCQATGLSPQISGPNWIIQKPGG